ncbi:hypothetical protein EMPS_06576 [Entomortierella parvispora]|uniref:RhoGAP-domain-containing protein n=1 Tax=Entomortierella parvispora TaxID=205924 RepID=A0A9P3HCZ4_9FUNG|nr:hypothetical protein EMPS_06576 [Entomortierella parvispora]
MTGEDAYHADCFMCVQCESKIDDLVFAKTSQGIYCMTCHKERKEAKRQRERNNHHHRDHVDRMTDKSLPTIPETQQKHSNFSSEPQLALQAPLMTGSHQTTSPPPRQDSRHKAAASGGGLLGMGPPLLPPLSFDFDGPVSSGFDFGEIMSGSEGEPAPSPRGSVISPTPVVAVEEPGSPQSPDTNQQHRLYRVSISMANARLSTSSLNLSGHSSVNNTSTRPSSESPEPETSLKDSIPRSSAEEEEQAKNGTMSMDEAMSLIGALRLELTKFNPSSPLLHGTVQDQLMIAHARFEQLKEQEQQLEKAVRDMYIEKDLLGMDLEVMNEELKAKENESLDANTTHLAAPGPPIVNSRFSTSHDFMKQAYQAEVKALQDQKEKLQQEIQAYSDQRDSVLDEMQVLSMRNAELSTINNDMTRKIQGRKDAQTTAPPTAPSASFNASGNNMLQSFTDKIRRQRQASGGSQQELKVSSSADSTHSYSAGHSDDYNPPRHSSKTEQVQEDIFGEEIVAPKKFNWKKGTLNTMNTGVNTVKNVGAKFGKLLVEGSNVNGDVPPRRNSPMVSTDNGSSNGQVLPPTTRSFSSDSRSLNGGRTLEKHFFIQHNYIRPARCDGCDEKMWGREYKCQSCGYQVHGRCAHDIPHDCTGVQRASDSSSVNNMTTAPTPAQKQQTMFGNKLQAQLELEDRAIPLVVEKCIEAVDQRGLDVEGIYRRSGMAAEARQLVLAYDAGYQPDLSNLDLYQDICSITSVMKQYLRSLPEPLMPYDLYQEFMISMDLPETSESPEQESMAESETHERPESEFKLQTFRNLIDRISMAHYRTLKVLMEHLNRVTERAAVNLMTPKNLSVVFGPTLMRNPDPSREILDTTYKNSVIEYLIVNTSELFVRNDPSPAMNESSSGGSSLYGDEIQNGRDQVLGGGHLETMAPPPGFTGQRQGSVGSVSSTSSPAMNPPPRRMNIGGPSNLQPQVGPGAATGAGVMPALPPRSGSGEAVPTMGQYQQQQQQQQLLHQQQQQLRMLQHQQHQQQQQQQQQQLMHQQLQQSQQYNPQAHQQFLQQQQQFRMAYPQPQHPTLQQLKQQQQQREQQQREQLDRERDQQQHHHLQQQQQQQQQQPQQPQHQLPQLQQSQQQHQQEYEYDLEKKQQQLDLLQQEYEIEP